MEQEPVTRRVQRSGGPPLPIRPRQGGYSAEGPGFYLWDEDRAEVLRVVREFERGNFDVAPTTRLLLVRPEGGRGESA